MRFKLHDYVSPRPSSVFLPRVLGVGHLRVDPDGPVAQTARHEYAGSELDLIHDDVRLEQQSRSLPDPEQRGVQDSGRWRDG